MIVVSTPPSGRLSTTDNQHRKKPLEPRITKLEHLNTTAPSRAKPLAIKTNDDVTTKKPDIHIRPDLVKPQLSYSCTSLHEGGFQPTFGDEVQSSRNTFNVGDMVDIGRPERDHSLRIPMMIQKQKQRKFKLGQREARRQKMREESMGNYSASSEGPTQLDDVIVTNTSANNTRVEEQFSMNDSLFSDPKESNKFRASKSHSHSRSSGEQKDIVVRGSSKLHLFQLANRPPIGMQHGLQKGALRGALPTADMYYPASAAVTPAGKNEVTSKMSNPNTPLAFSASDKLFQVGVDPLSPPGNELSSPDFTTAAESMNMKMKPQPIYAPDTFRLPKSAPVPGFGNNPEEIEQKLGSYWVHSNKAVATAAALEMASEISLTPSQTDGADTYRESEVESFVQSSMDQVTAEEEMEQQQQQLRQQQQLADSGEVGAEHQQGIAFNDETNTATVCTEDGDDASVSTVNVSISRRSDTEKSGLLLDTAAKIAPTPSSSKPLIQNSGHYSNPSILLAEGADKSSVSSTVVRAAEQQKLTCSICLHRSAALWCQECRGAFCGTCWVKVAHHELKYLVFEDSNNGSNRNSSSKNKSENNRRSAAAVGNIKPSPAKKTVRMMNTLPSDAAVDVSSGSKGSRSRNGSPSNRNSYSKSILFSGYYPGEGTDIKSMPKEKRYDSRSAAMIPLPDEVVLSYEDYPQCVFIDAQGHVVGVDPRDAAAHLRPYTSPATPAGQMHLLHFHNEQRRQKLFHSTAGGNNSNSNNNSNNNNSGNSGSLPVDDSGFRAAGGGARAVRLVRTTAGRQMNTDAASLARLQQSMGASNGIKYGRHYRGQLMPGSRTALLLQHSQGKVTVRRGQRGRPNNRLHTPALSAGAQGNVGLAYSAKPSTTAAAARSGGNQRSRSQKKPAADDWLDDLFKFDDPVSEEPYNDDSDPFKRRQLHPDRKQPNTPKNNPVPEKLVGFFEDKVVFIRPSSGSGKFSRAGSQKGIKGALTNAGSGKGSVQIPRIMSSSDKM